MERGRRGEDEAVGLAVARVGRGRDGYFFVGVGGLPGHEFCRGWFEAAWRGVFGEDPVVKDILLGEARFGAEVIGYLRSDQNGSVSGRTDGRWTEEREVEEHVG